MDNQHTTTGQTSTAGKVKDKVGDATEQVKETASHVAAGARDKGGELLDEGREKVQELKRRASETARSRAETEKDRLATGFRSLASTLRGDSSMAGDAEQIRPLLESAADRVERLSEFLETRRVDDLTDDLNHFARQHTPAFLSGAFALGFLGARFLKSSGNRALESRYPVDERYSGYEVADRFDRTLPESGTRDTRGSFGNTGTTGSDFGTSGTTGAGSIGTTGGAFGTTRPTYDASSRSDEFDTGRSADTGARDDTFGGTRDPGSDVRGGSYE